MASIDNIPVADGPPHSAGLYHLVSGFEQEITGPDYFWDNRLRGPVDPPVWVCQLTLAGRAYYEDAAGRQDVGVDHVMVFRHGEESVYGYPEDAEESYHLHFLMISGGQSTALFEWIRHRRGAVFPLLPGVPARGLFDRLFARIGAMERNRFEESGLIYRFLMELLAEGAAPVSVRDRLLRACDIIEDRFREPISVATVAAEVGWSREHLARQYHASFGRTISADLRQRRLDEARRLLRVSDESVTDIALRSGYADISTFVRAFRQRFGVSPGGFRRVGGR